MSQGMSVASGSWKSRGNILPQGLQKECSPAGTFILALERTF